MPPIIPPDKLNRLCVFVGELVFEILVISEQVNGRQGNFDVDSFLHRRQERHTMSGQSSLPTKSQLDKSEREHLEAIVTELRDNVEADIEYQLEHTYELNNEKGGEDLIGEEADTRAEIVKAVEREDDNKSWEEKFERYVMGVGYTIVNRLTSLRCMEVRGFIDRPVTQFGDSGTTPAAEKLENEQYLGPDEAKIEAYDKACVNLTDEIEILFDPESPYSIIYPDVDIFEELCRKLDDIPDEVWRADDVLGWVYEYYNASKLDDLRRKGDREGLAPADVPPANQFYTPHWVVRMLTDNSLTKMYLESKGELLSTIEEQQHYPTKKRKFRDISPNKTQSLADFSTYLVPTEEEGEAPDFDEPKEIRVIDPACGSGHFLLYAFDVLERIWRRECPNLDRTEIPKKILRHNLYGIDLDLRACQLAAFNLYLKARGRSEEEGKDDFEMPEVGIVCADAKIANVEAASEVFDEVAGDQPEVRRALEEILGAFENVQGLGSLLDVRGTLADEFTMEEQPTLMESISGPGSLNNFLKNLHREVDEHRNGESFLAQDLKSFLKVLVILSQDYDVALMNPPYGSRNRMPDSVQEYVESKYKYNAEFYINFFEVCENLVRPAGRIGMLIPRTFMFKRTFEQFREDFVGDRGAFDFLAEYGMGVLDNATVRTVGTIVRSGETQGDDSLAEFYRLHDISREKKEEKFLQAAYENPIDDDGIQRRYERQLSEFSKIPGSAMSYWVPLELRSLYESKTVFDADNGRVERDSLGVAKVGMQTGYDNRFTRQFWEVETDHWVPFAKGGVDAWIIPRINSVVGWGDNGTEVRRFKGSYLRNERYYFNEALAFNRIKEGGRRFGYLNKNSIFSDTGMVFIPEENPWNVLAYANSHLFTYLMIAQTTGRHWNVGEISRVPWFEQLSELSILEEHSKQLLNVLLAMRKYDFKSPYYTCPMLLDVLEGYQTGFWYDHPHQDTLEGKSLPSPKNSGDSSNSLDELGVHAARYQEELQLALENAASEIDQTLIDFFDIDSNTEEKILTEIQLRTNQDPYESREFDPSSITEPPENFGNLIKDLLLHVIIDIVNKDEDGVVPLTFESDQEMNLIDRIEDEFIQIFGEYAQDRLAEADQKLGDQQPESGAYPNIQAWVEDDLLEYHLSRFENTPVLWRLTTERLVSDPTGEGFACLVDYRQLDASLFDRIESRYLEPLKNEYRKRQNAANQRRSDGSLSTTEQVEAAEEYERYESALAQIDKFQEAALELSSEHPRDWDDEVQNLAEELTPKVAEFRNRTEERLETLDQLVNEMDTEEFEDLFSPTFLERVNENRDEWIDALQDLETACMAYSEDADQPIEAHLYDLFPYFDDLVGSTHYGSNGIFFMNYYFSKGEDYLDNGEPRGGLEGEIKLLAELAAETDDDVELGEEIREKCNELSKAIPSDWQERALAEVLTSGYDPVKKHGVAINILPLAEKKIVPEIVEDKVVN